MTLKEARREVSEAGQQCAELGRGAHLLSDADCVAIEDAARTLLAAVSAYRDERFETLVNAAV